jgi:hypothetical protein
MIEMVDIEDDKRDWFIRITLLKKDCPYRFCPANYVGCRNPITSHPASESRCSLEFCPYRVMEFPRSDDHLKKEISALNTQCYREQRRRTAIMKYLYTMFPDAYSTICLWDDKKFEEIYDMDNYHE